MPREETDPGAITMLVYRLLADLTVVIHATLVCFIILGLVVVLPGRLLKWHWVRNFWFRASHLGLIGLIAAFALTDILCPLTTLENWLRRQAGGETYPGSFLAHWVHEALFVNVSPQLITASYCAFGAAVLLAFLLVPPQLPWRGLKNSDYQ